MTILNHAPGLWAMTVATWVAAACGDPSSSTVHDGGAQIDAAAADGGAPPPDGGAVFSSYCTDNAAWTPTHYVTVDASGSGDGSLANPWTLGQAMQQAVAGNVVRVGPGIYVGQATGSRYEPAFHPASSGTPDAPIVFVAQHPAATSATERSQLGNNASAVDAGSPTFGASGRHDIVWDGFYVDEATAHSTPDTGPAVIVGSQRVRLCRNVIKGELIGRQDNHTGIRIDGSTDSEVVANEIFDIRSTPAPSQNFAAVMSYDAETILVANNYFHDNDVDVFIKGWHQDERPPNASWTIRFNRLERARFVSIHLLGVNGQPGLARTVVSNNLIVEPAVALFPHNGFGDREPSDFDFENNTVIDPTDHFLGVYSGNAGQLGLRDSNVRRNLVVGASLAYYFNEINGDVVQAFKSRGFDLDDNHFFGQATIAGIGNPNGGQYATVAELAAGTAFGAPGTGYERNGSQGDPRFVNAASGDYRLQAGSPARTAGVGGVPVGCYQTGDEIIGIP